MSCYGDDRQRGRFQRLGSVGGLVEVVGHYSRGAGAWSVFLDRYAGILDRGRYVHDDVRGEGKVIVAQCHLALSTPFAGAIGVHAGDRCGQDAYCRQLVGVNEYRSLFRLLIADRGRAVWLRVARYEDARHLFGRVVWREDEGVFLLVFASHPSVVCQFRVCFSYGSGGEGRWWYVFYGVLCTGGLTFSADRSLVPSVGVFGARGFRGRTDVCAF